jgi:hypothetical protein
LIILELLGRVPPGRAFGYIFYSAPLHKRIPPQSLTQTVKGEILFLRESEGISLIIELPPTLAEGN